MSIVARLNLCWILVVMFCSSCASVSEQSIRVVRDQAGQGLMIHAKATIHSAFDPDGGSREYNERIKISVFGKGRNMAYRNMPGIIYRFGQDFSVDVDYCNAGYLWISDDQKQLGISLFDVDPPVGLSPSQFNKVYLLTDAEVAIIKQNKN